MPLFTIFIGLTVGDTSLQGGKTNNKSNKNILKIPKDVKSYTNSKDSFKIYISPF